MFNSWMFYLILGLSASTLTLGWLSLSLHDDKVIAEQALIQAINVNSDMQESLNLKGSSCQIDASSGAELISEKNKIDEGIFPVNSQLKELATVKKTPSKVVTVVAPKQNETTKNESNFLPDDGLLSPSVTRLLHNGWCSVYPDSDQCISTRQPSGQPL
jgi:hypothetical protein